MKNIILIGSGNLATQLGLSLLDNGYNIIQVWSQQIKNAINLADKLNCNATDSLKNLAKADLYILAVKDDKIKSIVNSISVDCIVHTSGGSDIDIFDDKFKNFGVFYPLQTFNKEIDIDFENIPICIEANNKEFELKLNNLAKSLSKRITVLNSKQRKKLHVAAVFACNFSNHMYTNAYNLLKEDNIDFKLLIPLINQTILKLNDNKPEDVQTGPAKRKDVKLIEHQSEIITNKKIKELYQFITNSIIELNE